MEQQNNHQPGDEIELREMFSILKKRYRVIVAVTLIAIMASGIFSFYVLAPVYETRAVLLVTQAAPDNTGSGAGKEEQGLMGLVNTISRLPEMTINTYVGQLQSDAVMERVIKKLKLDQAGYTPASLAAYVTIGAVKDTNLIDVIVTHNDPFLATKIANTLTTEFLEFISATNEQQMGKSVEFLKNQAVKADEELKKSVEKLKSLQAQPRGADIIQQLITSKSQDLSKYQSRFLQVKTEHRQLLAGKQQAEAQLKITPPMLKVLKEQDRIGRLMETEEVNPAYTDLKTILNQKTIELAEKGSEVGSTGSVIGQLNKELKDLQIELAQKKTVLEMAQKEVSRLEETSALLKNKINETQIGRSLKFGETSLVVVSPAAVPDVPFKPNNMLNMAVALVIGLMVSVVMAFLLNYLDNTVKTPEKAEELFGLPVLGQIPVYKPFKGRSVKLPAENVGQPLNM